MTPEDTRHDGLVTAGLLPICRPAARHLPVAELDYLGDHRYRLRVRLSLTDDTCPSNIQPELVASNSAQSFVFKRVQRNNTKARGCGYLDPRNRWLNRVGQGRRCVNHHRSTQPARRPEWRSPATTRYLRNAVEQ